MMFDGGFVRGHFFFLFEAAIKMLLQNRAVRCHGAFVLKWPKLQKIQVPALKKKYSYMQSFLQPFILKSGKIWPWFIFVCIVCISSKHMFYLFFGRFITECRICSYIFLRVLLTLNKVVLSVFTIRNRLKKDRKRTCRRKFHCFLFVLIFIMKSYFIRAQFGGQQKSAGLAQAPSAFYYWKNWGSQLIWPNFKGSVVLRV